MMFRRWQADRLENLAGAALFLARLFTALAGWARGGAWRLWQ
jgi:hypothetical protein